MGLATLKQIRMIYLHRKGTMTCNHPSHHYIEEKFDLFSYATDWDQVILEKDKPKIKKIETKFRNDLKNVELIPLKPECKSRFKYNFNPDDLDTFAKSFSNRSMFNKCVDTFINTRMKNMKFWKQSEFDLYFKPKRYTRRKSRTHRRRTAKKKAFIMV
jgi:hypothetical protein